jgi:uncharacterized protein YjiS (DUF1127 family)
MIPIPHTKQSIPLSAKAQRSADYHRPAADGGYLRDAFELIEALVDGILESIRIRQQRNRSRRHLAQLNNHLLRDIGLTRDDIRDTRPQSFWR